MMKSTDHFFYQHTDLRITMVGAKMDEFGKRYCLIHSRIRPRRQSGEIPSHSKSGEWQPYMVSPNIQVSIAVSVLTISHAK